MMSEIASSSGAPPRAVDVSRRDLSKVSQISTISRERVNVAAINLDGNNLSTLHGIKQFPSLVQLSVTGNSLVRMVAVAPLLNLVSLNLQNNSLSEIAGLERLANLEWLCLAGNSIKSMDGLTANVKMNHLDISDNCISSFADISMLDQLKTLLLHGNAISSLQSVKENLPGCLNTLSLAENEVVDLNEVSFLSSLESLTQLSIMSNPCVSLTDSGVFDYRPFVCYWCPGVTTLDGYPITKEERQCSSTLFPHDQPCPFAVGQHQELIHYLYSASPLHTAQLLMTTENGGASTFDDYSTLTTVSGLEDIVLQRFGQSIKSDPKQADILEKLRALQVVEEMIKSQEHLLTGHADIPAGSNEPNDLLDPVTLERETKPPPKHALHAWTERVLNTSSPSPQVEEPVAEHTDTQTISGTLSVTNKSAVEERKMEQLKLLNAKIAQRHSKVVPKSGKSSFTAGSHGTRATSGSSKFKKMTQPHKQGSKSLESGKTITKTPVGNQRSLKSTVKGTKNSNPAITSASKSKTKPLVSKVKSQPESSRLPGQPFTKAHLPGVPIHPSEGSKRTLVKHSPVSKPDSVPQPSPSKHEPSFSIAATRMPAPDTPSVSTTLAHTDHDADMLSCTSYYVPVSEDVFGEDTLVSQFEAALEQDSQCGSSLLVSSLTQAYGLSENSDLLSTLQLQSHLDFPSTHSPSLSQRTDLQEKQAGFVQSTIKNKLTAVTNDKLSPNIAPYQLIKTNFLNGQVDEEVKRDHGKVENRAATVIQAVWRGYTARRRDPEVIRVRAELSRIKLEAFVAQNVAHLQGCRQELAHQSQVLQLQEETLQTLLMEVDSLRLWKAKVEANERRNAAVVIQKHWRGYRVRKSVSYRGVSLSKVDVLWALCVSLKNQMEEMRSTLESADVGKRVRFEKNGFLDSPGDHPPPVDLKMTHFSVSCILLRWTPACTPLHPDMTTLKCYRIYINGEVEGMVGAEKCKAYIEGLDSGSTYRITVRAVYNTGESQDSNPVVASLNPKNSTPTNTHSSLHSNSDSSDEETRHTEDKPFGELSDSQILYPQGQPGDTANNQEHSKEQRRTSPSEGTDEHEVASTDLPSSNLFAAVTQSNGVESTDYIQTDSTNIHSGHLQSDVATHVQPSQLQQVDQQDVEIEAGSLYHFQRAKHITIDTVSVLSGCTIEYSPPLPQASNSADTLRGESSLEYDVHSSGSDSTSTDSGTTNNNAGNNEREETEKSETLKTNNPVAMNETLPMFMNSTESEDKGHSSGQGEPSLVTEQNNKEDMTSVPNNHTQLEEGLTMTLASTQQNDFSDVRAVSHVTTVQASHAFVDEPLRVPIHEMSLPLSKHSSDMLSPVSYSRLQGDGQIFSLATILPHEPNSFESTFFDNMPLQTNSTGVLNTDLDICPPQSRKTVDHLSLQEYNKTEINDPGSEIDSHHNTVSNSYPIEVITKPTAVVIPEMTVTSMVTPETASALSLHTSHVVSKQPTPLSAYQVTSDKDIHRECKITDANVKESQQNKELGSIYEKPTKVSQAENGIQEQNLSANQNLDPVIEGLGISRQESCMQARCTDCLANGVASETNQLPFTEIPRADLIPSKKTGQNSTSTELDKPTTSIVDKHPLEQEPRDGDQKENSSAALAFVLLSQLETDLSNS